MLKSSLKIFVVLFFGLNIWAVEPNLTKVGIKNSPGQKKQPEKPRVLKIVTTLEVYAALAREIGGSRVSVVSLTSALNEPHSVKNKPSFKHHLGYPADGLFENGRKLELWLPQAIRASGNKKLISQEAVFTMSQGVKSLEVPQTLTRQEGDIHPQGNPHVWLSPTAVAQKITKNIVAALTKLSPQDKKYFEENHRKFETKLAKKLFGEKIIAMFGGSLNRLFLLHQAKKLKDYLQKKNQTLGGWTQKLDQAKYNWFSYHRDFAYLTNEFGLNLVGYVELKPGVPPTLAHRNFLVELAQKRNVKRIIAAKYYEGMGARSIRSVAEKIGGKYKFVYVDCKPKQSYVDFMDELVNEIAQFAPSKLSTPAKLPGAVKSSTPTLEHQKQG